ncbi:MAG: ribonuclease HII [Oscillospiraceae bacterium]|nr:ribonuclease HII [Oscillospiraceae bacterium]
MDEPEPDLYGFDSDIRKEYGVVCGIDEAGRGPLAGDVFAAAVILDEGTVIEGINDSKKLTEKKRELLFDEICLKARAYCIARASVEEIETLNILQADFRAMERAYNGLGIPAGIVLVDGNQLPEIDAEMRYVIKGDARSASIAAASILAKVARDRYMKQMAEIYPQYGFEKHKGYGTKAHYAAVEQYGLCEIHRKSFFKKYFEKKAAHE